MALEIPKTAYSGKIREMKLGGGDKAVTVGGETAYPFYLFEGELPRPPRIAMEVWDMPPEGWAPAALEPFKGVTDDPAAWAGKAVEESDAELICLKFDGIHPDKGDRDAEHAVDVVRKVLDAVDVPLILWGSGSPDKDNAVMPKVSELTVDENFTVIPVYELYIECYKIT